MNKPALLTTTDIQQISLYIPFRVGFCPVGNRKILNTRYPCGLIESTLIIHFDEEGGIEESWDLTCPEMDERPILRRLINMSEEEQAYFEKQIFGSQSSTIKPSKETIVDLVRTMSDIYCIFFALSKHFDLFGLIDAGKATDMQT